MQRLFKLGADSYFKQDFQKALMYYLQALALDVNNSVAYYNLGLTYDAMREYELAVAHYKKAIAINPNDIRSANNIAWVFFENIKDIDTACKYLDYAIQIAPNDAEAYNVYGNIYYSKKDYKLAVSYFKKAVTFDKKYAKNHYDIAKAYIGLEKYTDAYKSIKSCLKINPNYPLANDLLKSIEKFI